MKNPLTLGILEFLSNRTVGISEYDLMQYLTEHEFFNHVLGEGQLALFQKHFITMNALYELQHQLWQDEEIYLEVSPLNIQLFVSCTNEGGSALTMSETEKLSNYYRDWSNFENTNDKDVEDLLACFWQRFVSLDKRGEAFVVLELEVDAAKKQIVESYRRLAAKHHPDKGGDKEMFIRVRQAYEILKINS